MYVFFLYWLTSREFNLVFTGALDSFIIKSCRRKTSISSKYVIGFYLACCYRTGFMLFFGWILFFKKSHRDNTVFVCSCVLFVLTISFLDFNEVSSHTSWSLFGKKETIEYFALLSTGLVITLFNCYVSSVWWEKPAELYPQVTRIAASDETPATMSHKVVKWNFNHK